MMDDLISRQAAIDAVHEDILLKSLNDSWYRENHEFVTVGYVERTLLALPSAQQIVRCKDCIHRPIEIGANSLKFPDFVCPCQCEDYYYSWMPSDNFFCANGEGDEQ